MAQEERHDLAEGKANTFANDGSFLELFKKRMEQQKSQNEVKPDGDRTKQDVTPIKTEANDTSVDSSDTRTSESQSDKEKKSVHKPYQAIIGKRKAMMKSIELREKRKRRREEIEEQQNVEDEASKSSAWKAYMAEVKSYEAQNCTDDDNFKRPLVK